MLMPHSDSDILFRLPASLAGEALGYCLDIKDIINLDTAFCSRTLRPCWLQLLQAAEFQFQNQITRTNRYLWSWLNRRKLKITSLKLDVFSEGSDIAEIYLRACGKSVRRIEVDDGLPVDVALVANHCNHLTHFSYSTMIIDEHFERVLQHNPNLESIHFGGLMDLSIDQLHGLSLTHLHTISLNNCQSCTDEMVLHLVGMSSKVTKIGLIHCQFVTSATVAKIAAMFPRLQMIGLGALQVDNSTINAIAKSCPQINTLLLYGNCAVTDAGLQQALQNLHNLRVLDIQACQGLTDLTLANIAKYSCNTLEVLNIGEKMSFGAGSVGSMLAACTQLRTFVWSAEKSVYYCKSELASAFTALRNIRTLLLGDGMSCDAALHLVAQHCPRLQHLNIYTRAPDEEDSDFEEDAPVQLQYTSAGVFAVAQGCASLRTVVCKDSEVLNDLARRLWKLHRPQVSFSQDDWLFCSDISVEPL